MCATTPSFGSGKRSSIESALCRLILASSAGTGLLVRYLGEEGEQAKRDGTVAAVAISPG